MNPRTLNLLLGACMVVITVVYVWQSIDINRAGKMLDESLSEVKKRLTLIVEDPDGGEILGGYSTD